MEKEVDLIEEEKAIQEATDWLKQKIFSDIEEECFQRGSFSVYIINASDGERLYEGVGFSKARQEISVSQYDSERGKAVSRGRAIHDLFSDYKKGKKNDSSSGTKKTV